MAVTQTVSFEGARIGFKNFAGKEGPYNKAGDRNFVVFLDDEVAAKMEADGWNIKFPKPNDKLEPDQDERQAYLPVAVSFGAIPPKVIVIMNDNPTKLDEAELDMLDWARILNVDLIVRPYNWEMNGNKGVKAYLKSIYVTIDVDEFEQKYGI